MKKFFWLHIKKAGGESMRKGLGDFYKEMDRLNPKPFIALPKAKWNDAVNNFRIHLGPYDYKRMLFAKKFLYNSNEFENMFKFVIVRNPYDRAVSSWLYCTRNNWKWRIFNSTFKKRAFQYFLERLPKIWKKKTSRHTATHTRPVMPDITDNSGEILVDYIGKLENISDDFNYICDEIGIPHHEFPVVNSSGRVKKYRNFYNKKSKKLVEQYYKNDIENFDYSF